MDVEGDAHCRHAARGEVYMQRSGPRKSLAGAGVGGMYSSDVLLVDRCTRGMATRAQPMRNVYICHTVPNSVLELPECA